VVAWETPAACAMYARMSSGIDGCAAKTLLSMNATTRRVAESAAVSCVDESNTERNVGFVTEKTPRVNVTRCRNGTESGVSSVMVRLLCGMVVKDGRQIHHRTT